MDSGYTSRILSSSTLGTWEELDRILRNDKTSSSTSAPTLAPGYDPGSFNLGSFNQGGPNPGGSYPLYLRQSSWPVPERTPHQPLPSTPFMYSPQLPNEDLDDFTNNDATAMRSHAEDENMEPLLKFFFSLPPEWRAKMMNSCRIPPGSPNRRSRVQKRCCRFCQSNGERYEIYTSHELKDNMGLVLCPVLRAYECPRCKSTGDYAHTIRYCPFSTFEERAHSLGLNTGLRMASGRLRQPRPAARPAPPSPAPTPAPLDEVWAQLEHKLNIK